MPELTKEKLQDMIDDALKGALAKHTDAKAWFESEKAKADPDPEAVLAGALEPMKGAPADPDEPHMIGGMVRAVAATEVLEVPGNTRAERAMKIAHDVHRSPKVAKALELQNLTTGGALVADERLPGVVELLRSGMVVRDLQPTIIPMVNGSASIPKITGGSTATYIGEGQNISKSELTTGLLQFRERKLASLTPVSNDLLRVPSAAANTVVEDDLRYGIGLRADLAFLRGDGTQYVPNGLESLCPTANVFNSQASPDLAKMTTDLTKLVLALEEGNSRMIRPGFVFAPRIKQALMTIRDSNGNFAFRDEMLAGTLWGFPYGVSNQIPTNLGAGTESLVFFADWADVVIAESMTIELEASSVAAYHDGSQVQAAYSLDQTVVRAIEKHDFGVRHEESIAMLDTVVWTP